MVEQNELLSQQYLRVISNAYDGKPSFDVINAAVIRKTNIDFKRIYEEQGRFPGKMKFAPGIRGAWKVRIILTLILDYGEELATRILMQETKNLNDLHTLIKKGFIVKGVLETA